MSTSLHALMPRVRRLLQAQAVFVFVAGGQLYIASEQTDTLFAWTISPPITAAFFGAIYWASLPLVFLAARQSLWANARIAVPATLVMESFVLFATLIHLDRFHLNSTQPLAQAAAWAWLVIYILIPLATVVLLPGQWRSAGGDPARTATLAPWVRISLLTQGTVMFGVGAALFVAPQITAAWWPWMLTPLTARVAGGFLMGLAVAAFQMWWENDLGRIYPASVAYCLLAGLELIAVVRYQALVNWSSPPIFAYVVFVLSMLLVGVYDTLGQRSRRSLHVASVEPIQAPPV